MAHSKQAKKRIRQNDSHNLRNKQSRGSMRTYTKKLMDAVSAGNKQEAERLLPIAAKQIDKAARNSVIHKNAAARKKGQIMRAVQGMK